VLSSYPSPSHHIIDEGLGKSRNVVVVALPPRQSISYSNNGSLRRRDFPGIDCTDTDCQRKYTQT